MLAVEMQSGSVTHVSTNPDTERRILQQLASIDTSLEYIKAELAEVKEDLKEVKADAVSRERRIVEVEKCQAECKAEKRAQLGIVSGLAGLVSAIATAIITGLWGRF